MKRLLTTIFLLFWLGKVSFSCCQGDDRTLTEMLFQGSSGTIFTCKILTFSTPKYSDNNQVERSDGSIDGTATAEIIEVYFGKVDTIVVTLRAGSYLTVGKIYLIYTEGSGRVFGFGGYCDKWTKQVIDNPNTTNELLILKTFSDIFKNKTSGQFTFTNANNIFLAEGKFEKGTPIKTWKHYYDNGTIKAEFDLDKNVTLQYSDNGFINFKSIVNKNIGIYERYSNQVNGLLTCTFTQVKNDTGMVMTVSEYFDNGNIKNLLSQVNINTKDGGMTSAGKTSDYKEYFENGKVKLTGQYWNDKRIGLWKWFEEDGTFKTQFDYKDGMTNQ